MVLAYYFGARAERDAYFSAMTMPAYVVALFVGSFTAIFLPYLVDFKKKNDSLRVVEFVSNTFGLCVLSLSVIVITGFLFSTEIVSLTAPGFDDEQLLATRDLFNILVFTVFFQSLSSFINVFHHIENRFLLPSISPIVIPVTALFFVLLFNDYGIKSLAVGTLVGSMISMLIILPRALRQVRFNAFHRFISTDMQQLVKLAFPLFVSGAVYKLTTVVERVIASRLPSGSISYLGYGSQIYLLLATIASGSIATTFYPLMSVAWSEGNMTELRNFLSRGIKLILFITLPIASVFIVAGEPVVELLFQRGAFNSTTTVAVADTLKILMIAFVLGSVGTLLAKIFYITKRTFAISVISISEVLIYSVSGYLLSIKYSYLGLATALSLSIAFGVIVSTILLYKEKFLFSKDLYSDVLKLLATAFFCHFATSIVYNYFMTINTWAAVTISVLITIAFYLLMTSYVLKLSDSEAIKKMVRNYFA